MWQLENGGRSRSAGTSTRTCTTFHVYDNDVIHAEHYDLEAEAVFRSRHAGSGTLGRFLFEDIRVENANWRLFYLVLENNKWYDPALGYGEIEQMIFRNIHAYSGLRGSTSIVRGIDSTQSAPTSTSEACTPTATIPEQRRNLDIDPATSNVVQIYRSTDGAAARDSNPTSWSVLADDIGWGDQLLRLEVPTRTSTRWPTAACGPLTRTPPRRSGPPSRYTLMPAATPGTAR